MAAEIKTFFEKDRYGIKGTINRFLIITFGAVLMAFNIKTFVQPGHLVPGGVTGLALLTQHILSAFAGKNIPFVFLSVFFNAIPIFIGFKFIGKKFTLYSCYMILLSGFLVDFIPEIFITNDILLAAIFGGCINAFSIFLCLKAGATSGGTDFVAIYISEKFSKDAWNYILSFNVIILCVSGALFGWENALYSIFFQFASTQMLGYTYKRYQTVTLFVITNKTDEIYDTIKATTNHDATLFKGTGCYEKAERDLIYSVVSGEDVRKLMPKIKEKDPSAFINIVKSKQTLGKFYRKPND